jgi:hypothetical protein
MQNHACAEEADAGDDALERPQKASVAGLRQLGACQRDERRTDRNERVCPQSGGLPIEISVQADDRADENGGTEAQQFFAEI